MSPSDFRLIFPVFNNRKDQEIQAQIDLATPYFDVDRWVGFYTEGLANYVAHQLVWNDLVAKNPTAGDAVTKTVGKESITRDRKMLNRQADDPFQLTMYGRKYRSLAEIVGAGAFVSPGWCV